MGNLENLVIKAKEMMDQAGIKYDKSYNVELSDILGDNFGFCHFKEPYILINSKIMVLSDDKIINTIVHEFIHTCKGCDNHYKKFKIMCKKFNDKYPDMPPIQSRVSDEIMYEFYEHHKSDYKYKSICGSCGRVWYYKNNCKIVKQNGVGWLCGVCKDENLKIEEV